jgi:hypothetical protein
LILNKLISIAEKNSQKVILFFFIALLGLGLGICKDYGISWDEQFQRNNNGYANYNFIVQGEKDQLLSGHDKYHGPAFELVLVGTEKLFRLEDLRTIFLFRHLITFLAFYCSSVFLFLLAQKMFSSRKMALLALLFYVLSPHIFSHAFYNSKDIAFLSFFTISIYFMFVFLEKPDYKRALFFAFLTAFTVDIRIIGLIIPFLFLCLLVVEAGRRKRSQQTMEWKPVLLFFAALPVLIILFWPVLWLNPLHHFVQALKENSNYPWNDPVLYFGNEYKPKFLPWHYLFFWMFVSRPVLYSILFLCGLAAMIRKLLKPEADRTYVFTILSWFFIPLLAMIVFKSPAFDTGRHLYFLHGAFVLISVYGVMEINNRLKNVRFAGYTFYGLIALSFVLLSCTMIRLHPFEHLYFNFTQGFDEEKKKNRFEYDYWGLSGKQLLEELLKKDSSAQIKIFAEHLPGELNAYMLPFTERSRLFFSKTLDDADYYLADYRWKRRTDYPFKREVCSVSYGNTNTSTVFRIRKSDELYACSTKTILSFQRDFEKKQQGWSGTAIDSLSGAHSGTHATKVDSANEFSETLTLPDLQNLKGNTALILKSAFWIYDPEPGSSAKFVISFETKSGTPYFWQTVYELKAREKKTNDWKEIRCAAELPAIRNADDKIKIYLLNTGKKKILMDDVILNFEEERAAPCK